MTLLILTRYPQPGHVKTRIIPRLGKHGACRLHHELTRHTLARLGAYPRLQIWFEGGSKEAMRNWLGHDFAYRRQPAGNLGIKMIYAFEAVFAEGESKAVLVGTDCPGITRDHITDAMERLDNVDVVLGPAVDGGYYLIGLKNAYPSLFKDIPWGTGQVCAMTSKRASEAGLAVSFLDTLADIDRPEDLSIWQNF